MKITLISLTTLLAISCGHPKDSSSTDSLKADSAKKYNPPVDTTYFYPADSIETVATTKLSEYTIKTTIAPTGNPCVNYFREHSGKGRFITDKIKRRDFKVRIDITNSKDFHKTEVLNRELFRSIITNTDFISSVKFIGQEGDKFRFDVTFSFLDDKPSMKVKLFLSRNDLTTFENYPESYYDSLYPSPD